MNLDKLRAIVDAATPRSDRPETALDWAEYIRTFNPAVVRAMLGVCEAASVLAKEVLEDYTAYGQAVDVNKALAALDEALK